MPNFRQQVLETTLSQVCQRQTRRRQTALSSTAGLLAAMGVLWWTLAASAPPGNGLLSHTAVEQESARQPPSFIQRIPSTQGPLRHVTRLTSSSSSRIERLPHREPSVRAFPLQPLTDEELFSSLPPNQAAALVVQADGRSRLVVLPSPAF